MGGDVKKSIYNPEAFEGLTNVVSDSATKLRKPEQGKYKFSGVKGSKAKADSRDSQEKMGDEVKNEVKRTFKSVFNPTNLIVVAFLMAVSPVIGFWLASYYFPTHEKLEKLAYEGKGVFLCRDNGTFEVMGSKDFIEKEFMLCSNISGKCYYKSKCVPRLVAQTADVNDKKMVCNEKLYSDGWKEVLLTKRRVLDDGETYIFTKDGWYKKEDCDLITETAEFKVGEIYVDGKIFSRFWVALTESGKQYFIFPGNIVY